MPKKASSFRGDLEGIRGIALVIILFTHLIEFPTGGFVALDIFFVLSGYLITGLLLREYRLTGTISLNGFYRRRIRRLMPSAMLVLVATSLAGLFVFILPRAVQTLWDAFWSLLLVSNWNFALTGTDYFATTLPQSPLLHFWSLSVEEQFYLFWPAIVLGLLIVGAGARSAGRRRVAPAAPIAPADPTLRPRSTSRRRPPAQSFRPLILGIAVVSLLSFAWGVIQADAAPQVSYLSTLTRIWELGAGALLCFTVPLASKIPAMLRPVLAWGGLVVILVCAFVYTPALHYPGFWCLIPVASTVLIIVAGMGGDSHLVITTNPVARYLGKISYTSYLWHWPIFIFFGVLFGRESPVYLFAAMPLSLAVAALTTRFVEDPIRHSSWLEPRLHHRDTDPRARHHRRTDPGTRSRRIRIGFAVAGVTVAVALIGVIALAPRTQVASLPVASVVDPGSLPVEPGATSTAAAAAAAAAAPAAGTASSVGSAQKVLTDAITVGLTTADWPSDLTPGLDKLDLGALAPQWVEDGCLDVSDENVTKCVYGDASLGKTAVLLGDSAAISYMPGLIPALGSLGYRVQALTHSECTFANVQVLGQSKDGAAAPGFPAVCDDHRAWSIDKTLQLKPDLVIVTDAESEVSSMVITGDDKRFEALQAGVTDSLSKIEPLGVPVVMLAGPPATIPLSDCATRINHPSDCTKPISNTWLKQLNVTQKAAAEVSATSAQPVSVVDTRLWFCAENTSCPPFAGTTIIRGDVLHLTAVYARMLEPILTATLRSLLPPA
ncbi:hypothetical protein B7R21_12120 [Subtercola boreus]|uniref:Acyltransferase n=1 Tax=Subtercola boreus TaxID=120213 RepID=A0A3E0VN90_9MICO|nr:acyltransferase family protein [Subtercola boreus]RFA11454.1 hypothetical protein B7R21_12120 [Subtercola boreus]